MAAATTPASLQRSGLVSRSPPAAAEATSVPVTHSRHLPAAAVSTQPSPDAVLFSEVAPSFAARGRRSRTGPQALGEPQRGCQFLKTLVRSTSGCRRPPARWVVYSGQSNRKLHAVHCAVVSWLRRCPSGAV